MAIFPDNYTVRHQVSGFFPVLWCVRLGMPSHALARKRGRHTVSANENSNFRRRYDGEYNPCRRAGFTPWGQSPGRVMLRTMNLIILLIVLLLLFGGGGFYFGGPAFGGGALGLILVVALIVYVMGGFRGGRV